MESIKDERLTPSPNFTSRIIVTGEVGLQQFIETIRNAWASGSDVIIKGEIRFERGEQNAKSN